MLAPFYFKKGDSLAAYIEENMDAMNQLKPLVVPDDPDFQDESEHEESEKDPKEEKNDQKEEASNDEPQIEEAENKSENQIQTNQPAAEIVKDLDSKQQVLAPNGADGSNEFEELSEDIFMNF